MWNDFQLSVLFILCTLIEFTHFPNRLHSIYCVALDNNWRPTPDRLWAHGNPCSGWKQGMFLYSADFRSCFLWTNTWKLNICRLPLKILVEKWLRWWKLVAHWQHTGGNLKNCFRNMDSLSERNQWRKCSVNKTGGKLGANRGQTGGKLGVT